MADDWRTQHSELYSEVYKRLEAALQYGDLSYADDIVITNYIENYIKTAGIDSIDPTSFQFRVQHDIAIAKGIRESILTADETLTGKVFDIARESGWTEEYIAKHKKSAEAEAWERLRLGTLPPRKNRTLREQVKDEYHTDTSKPWNESLLKGCLILVVIWAGCIIYACSQTMG